MPDRTTACRTSLRSPGAGRVSAICRALAAWASRHRFPPGLLVALLVLPAFTGCGLKTAPRPLSEVMKPTADVEARQRGDEVLVSWLAPDGGQVERFDRLEGFDLWVQARPMLCLECPPQSPARVELEGDDPALVQQGARYYYALRLPPDAGRLSVDVRTRFGVGTTPAGIPAIVERAADIPAPELRWRWVGRPEGAEQPANSRSVQFYWEAPRERIVQVIDATGRPWERVVQYRANLYRRVAPEPWPLQPLNGAPLEVTQWIVPSLQPDFPDDAAGEAYELRYVDRFGNEGPPSPEVLIPLPEDRS